MGLLDLFKGKSAQEKFAQRFMQALRAAGEARPLHFNEADFVVRAGASPENPEHIFALHNAYREWERAAPAEREAVISRYTSYVNRDSLPSDYASTTGRLHLAIKDRTYPELRVLHNRLDFPATPQDGGNMLAYVPIAGDLIACIVDDDGPSMQFLTAKSMTDWNVSLERAADDALANMRKTLEWKMEDSDGLFASRTGDTYDASRLMFKDAIRALPLKGAPVALVPDRETLLIAGSDDTAALLRMAESGRQRFEEADRLVSGAPLVLREDGWAVFQPPEAVAAPFGNLARLFEGRYYADQKEALDKLHERDGVDILVASYSIVDRENSGRYMSWAAWTRGVLSLLPKVDELFFYDPTDKSTRMASWDAAQRAMGDRMQPAEHVLGRWRVDSFPSSEELIGMGARTLD